MNNIMAIDLQRYKLRKLDAYKNEIFRIKRLRGIKIGLNIYSKD